MATQFITVVPAYGRDYKSKKEVLVAWNDEQDFVIADAFHGNGRYINKRDAEANPDLVIHVRYKRQTMIAEMPRAKRKSA